MQPEAISSNEVQRLQSGVGCLMNYVFLKYFAAFAVLPAILPILLYAGHIELWPKSIIYVYIILLYGAVYIPFSLWIIKKKSSIYILSFFGIFLWMPYILYCSMANWFGVYIGMTMIHQSLGGDPHTMLIQASPLSVLISAFLIVYFAFIVHRNRG